MRQAAAAPIEGNPAGYSTHPQSVTRVKEGPLVSVGLPVFNGEDFVAEAIESILSQTYQNIELVISDNASSDRTGEICQAFAARDRRVRYHRNDENLGAAQNYTIVFSLATGRYFKWAAHDDALEPAFVERCLEVLQADPGVVLCYTSTTTIDGRGRRLDRWGAYPGLDAALPHQRFRATFLIRETFPIWGLTRREVLRQTGLLGPYVGHDRPLLAELALHGRFHCVDELLFLHREHPQRSIRVYNYHRPDLVIEWYAPAQGGRLVFAQYRLLAEYWAALMRAPVSSKERLWSMAHLAAWAVRRHSAFTRDLFLLVTRVPLAGKYLLRLYSWYRSSRSERESGVRFDGGPRQP